MAATASQTSKAIEPGSVPHGDRQSLEQGLSAVMGGGGGAAPAGPPGMSGRAGIGPSDPLGAALAGDVTPGEGPLTSGLSLGPGPGGQGQVPNLELREKLLAIAENAKSPQLRAQARIALRKVVRSS